MDAHRTPRPTSRPTGRRALRSLGGLAAVAVVVLAGCGLSDRAGSQDEGPDRISPLPRHEIAEEMIAGPRGPATRLPACELLDLTTAEVAELTGLDLPDATPIGSGDLVNICTYGGPGSIERQAAEQEAAQQEAAQQEAAAQEATAQEATAQEATSADNATTAPAETTTNADAETATPTSDTTTSAPPEDEERTGVPDTVAAGVVKPRSGAPRALAGQPTMLGARYACTEIRGADASAVEGGVPAAPEAPAPVRPDLDSAYIDCVAGPAGGGIEVHTILIADDDVWHLTMIRPETPRSPEAEAEALTSLHRLAETILD